jgi:pseudouridine synthase
MKERLQKILARAGHGSRRHCETLITAGRVRVNGAIAELGAQADADIDRIDVDGTELVVEATPVYLAMNKPHGVLTTATDPQGRRTVMELLPPGLPPHVFPIGRLDRDTEGLLLFTSDGELAHRLAHPRYEMDKEYYALVSGAPSHEALGSLRSGVLVEGRLTSPAEADIGRVPYGHHARAEHTWLRIVIHEGRKRQVRLMCAAVDHPVRALVRTRIGGIELSRLAPGTTRTLSQDEVDGLRKLVQLA